MTEADMRGKKRISTRSGGDQGWFRMSEHGL